MPIAGKFYKYHGAGNDYIVINPAELKCQLKKRDYIRICNRHFGIGSDGILLGPHDKSNAVSIINPDGSIAEKSGNGLRIFARYLWEEQIVKTNKFTISTITGDVHVKIENNGKFVSVLMGKVSFLAEDIPIHGFNGEEMINKSLDIITSSGEKLQFNFSAVNIGNPHCVIFMPDISEEKIKSLGPLIEKSKIFPNRVNVQFAKIIDRSNIKIEIWERGAGYTLSSGTSSCAVVAAAKKQNFCDSEVKVHMRGGIFDISIKKDWSVELSGPVVKICEGELYTEIFSSPNPQ